jgi:hypothetical protein
MMFGSARVSAISLFGDLPFGEEHYIPNIQSASRNRKM